MPRPMHTMPVIWLIMCVMKKLLIVPNFKMFRLCSQISSHAMYTHAYPAPIVNYRRSVRSS
jgi:hypothetical protein